MGRPWVKPPSLSLMARGHTKITERKPQIIHKNECIIRLVHPVPSFLCSGTLSFHHRRTLSPPVFPCQTPLLWDLLALSRLVSQCRSHSNYISYFLIRSSPSSIFQSQETLIYACPILDRETMHDELKITLEHSAVTNHLDALIDLKKVGFR